MNKPKPQTLLTDALLKTGTNVEQLNEALERSRKIELKLQEAERQRDEAESKLEVLGDRNAIEVAIALVAERQALRPARLRIYAKIKLTRRERKANRRFAAARGWATEQV